MNILPLNDRIIIKRYKEEEKTTGGILIPDSAKEKANKGEVISVGPGKILDNGNMQKVSVKPGDKVIFTKYSGNDIKINNEELLVLREEDIIGIIKE